MMAENPNFWWSLSGKPPLVVSQQSSTNFLSPPPPPQPSSNNFFPPQYLFGASPAALLPPNSLLHHDHSQDHFPLSWSQLLMGGLTSDHQEENGGTSSSNCGQFKKLENWEDHQILNPSLRVPIVGAVKRELDQTRHLIYNNSNDHSDHGEDDELQACSSSWSSQVNQIPSAGSSCVSSATNVLDFSTNKRDQKNQHSQHLSEYNGTSTSGTPAKKARVQPSSSQPPLKVRKEKLGDRITALHQIVSPFGKTDTASVLLEAIGYIRFLEGQIEALSSPYLGNASDRMRNQHFVKGERRCISAEEPGQDTGKDATNDRDRDRNRELRSRGLCLVPVSCTDHIDLGNNNGSDYWAPALGGGGGGF